MRYFVKTDKNQKITHLFRFNADPFSEEMWNGKAWEEDADGLVSKQLVTGEGDLDEVSRQTVRKWFPKAL